MGATVVRTTRSAPDRGVRLELASLASVRAAADAIRSTHDRLDLLINNAGVMEVPYQRTEDGFELTLATNHLGHFALTGLLLDLLLATPGSRVVTVSSNAHRRGVMRFDDLQSERAYDAAAAYAQSKLANLLFTYELQARLEAIGAARSRWPPTRATPARVFGGPARPWSGRSSGSRGSRRAPRRGRYRRCAPRSTPRRAAASTTALPARSILRAPRTGRVERGVARSRGAAAALGGLRATDRRVLP